MILTIYVMIGLIGFGVLWLGGAVQVTDLHSALLCCIAILLWPLAVGFYLWQGHV